MSNKNSEIKKAIDTFDTETARALLREALKEANAETYYLASLVSLDDEQKRIFLQKSLEIDPFFEKSHEALKVYTNINTVSKPNLSENILASKSTLSSDITTDITQYITATVEGDSDNIILYVIPIETGLTRTQLRKGTKTILIERDERAEWFLCGYLSPIGQPIIGWLPSSNLHDANYSGNEINLLDLPITRFEPYNSRSEVQKLIVEKKKKLKNYIAPAIGGSLFMLFACVSLGVSVSFFAAATQGTPLYSFLGCITGIAILFFSAMSILGFVNSAKAQQHNPPFNEELKRLDLLQKDMRNEYERLRDDQRFTMGIQAGLDTAKNLIGIAGSTVATKILTESQSKPKKK